MRTIGEQAKDFREARGWNYTRMAAEVTKVAGFTVSRQAITQLEEAGDRKPKYLQALAHVMGISTDDLLAGKLPDQGTSRARYELLGDPEILEENTRMIARHELEQPEHAGTMNNLRRVPIVGTARMGEDGFYEEMSSLPGAGDGHIDIATGDPNAYGLRVRGTSMAPAIRDGWYVVVEPNGQLVQGEYVLIKLLNGKKMVKELLFQRNGAYEIMSVNGEERRTIYNDEIDGIQAVGAVVPPSKWKPD